MKKKMNQPVSAFMLIGLSIVLSGCGLASGNSSASASHGASSSSAVSSAATAKLIKTITVYQGANVQLIQTYTYDGQNRITNVASTWPSLPVMNGYLTYVYPPDGSMVTISYTNQVYAGTNTITTYFASNMINTVTNYQGTTVFSVKNYEYDVQGRLSNLSTIYPSYPGMNNSTVFAQLSNNTTALIYFTNNVYVRTNSISTINFDGQNRITNNSSYDPSSPGLTNTTVYVYFPDGSFAMIAYTNNIYIGTNGITTFY